MIVHINKEYLLRCENTIVDHAAGYTEIISSYILSYLLNDDTEFEFEFDDQYNENIIELTTKNIRAIFPEFFIMNHCVKDLNEKVINLGITIDLKINK
jgi:hypothetical protein